MTLPSAGVWRLVAAAGRNERALTRVRALATYPLAVPAQVLQTDDALLVVERLGRDRILRVELVSGRTSVFSRAVPAPWGLARAADGDVLVSGDSGIYALTADAAARRIADVRTGPIAAADGGDLFFANEGAVGRVHAGAVSVLTTDVAAPHGLFVSATGELVVSDSGHGRLIRLDRATGSIDVVASGLDQPLGAIDDGAGGALVVEFGAGRLVQVRANGTRSAVTASLRKPYALSRAADGAVYVVEGGDDRRASGGLARVAADGTLTRLRLVPSWPAT
jgi:sugar lactone lactonase YvrE